jgi:predicted RNase H-like nuclease (RuvC/YqgF family)
MKHMKHLSFVTVFLLCALSPLCSQSETLGSIYTSLDELERTLLDIQSGNESLKADTQALKESLRESEAANRRLQELSEELRTLSTEQAESYRTQSVLLERSERRLKGWRLASIIEWAALCGILAIGLLAN